MSSTPSILSTAPKRLFRFAQRLADVARACRLRRAVKRIALSASSAAQIAIGVRGAEVSYARKADTTASIIHVRVYHPSGALAGTYRLTTTEPK